jgi:hypothetical protein
MLWKYDVAASSGNRFGRWWLPHSFGMRREAALWRDGAEQKSGVKPPHSKAVIRGRRHDCRWQLTALHPPRNLARYPP